MPTTRRRKVAAWRRGLSPLFDRSDELEARLEGTFTWPDDVKSLCLSIGPDVVVERLKTLLDALQLTHVRAGRALLRDLLSKGAAAPLLGLPTAEVLMRLISISGILGISLLGLLHWYRPLFLIASSSSPGGLLLSAEAEARLAANMSRLEDAIRQCLPAAKEPRALAQALACCSHVHALQPDIPRIEARLRDLAVCGEASAAASALAAEGYPPVDRVEEEDEEWWEEEDEGEEEEEGEGGFSSQGLLPNSSTAEVLAPWLSLDDDNWRVVYLRYKHERRGDTLHPEIDPLVYTGTGGGMSAIRFSMTPPELIDDMEFRAFVTGRRS